MKVFVSWSGRRSKAVAELLSDWIKCVLQASQPWISTRHIDKGAIWFSEISDQLRETAAGIVCLTHENKNKPWILFETGALAKGLSTNRVCTFLIDLGPADIEDPLAQFNHTTPDQTSMWGLISSLNSCLEGARLDERILQQVFETYWPKFEKDFAIALASTPQEDHVEPRSEDSILAEILANTRVLSTKVRDLESRVMLNPEPGIDINLSKRNPFLKKGLLAGSTVGTSLANSYTEEVKLMARNLGLTVEDFLNLVRDSRAHGGRHSDGSNKESEST